MTLDEAIKHAEEVAEEKRYEYQECLAVHDTEEATNCETCAEEHRQLAEWLKDYKRLLEQEPCEDCISRQAVLEQINCWIGSGEYGYTNATHYLTRRIQNLPFVTPQSKEEEMKIETLD